VVATAVVLPEMAEEARAAVAKVSEDREAGKWEGVAQAEADAEEVLLAAVALAVVAQVRVAQAKARWGKAMVAAVEA